MFSSLQSTPNNERIFNMQSSCVAPSGCTNREAHPYNSKNHQVCNLSTDVTAELAPVSVFQKKKRLVPKFFENISSMDILIAQLMNV